MAKFSVRKPLTVFVVVLAVVILGVVSLFKMTPDMLPNMNFPYVVIMTTYPGASPETVEEEITKPMEQSMATLDDIKSLSSTSAENYSLVMLEFEESVNMDTVGVDIQQNISTLSASWDDVVGTPYVLKINPSMLPVAVAAVSMEDMDVVELTDFVEETLMQELEGTSGVASISVSGAVDRQVHVVISQEKIDDVNRRMKAAVNKQLDDAKAELEETKAELEEAQAALEEAESQLDSGKDTLVDQTSAAEAEISSQQIALLEGKIQLQQQLVTLAETKSELETTLSILGPIADSLSELEAKETELNSELAALKDLRDRLDAADEALAAFGTPPEEEPSLPTLPDIELPDNFPDISDIITSDTEDNTDADTNTDTGTDTDTDTDTGDTGGDSDADSGDSFDWEGYEAALAAVEAIEAELEAMGTDRYMLPLAILQNEASLAAVETALDAIDTTLGTLDMSREDVHSTIIQMEEGLIQIEDGTAQINDALAQMEDGTLLLTDAMITLSSSTSAGLLELANAAAQITMNSATLTSAMTQVESGLEQIEDSRTDALASADMSGTLTLETVATLLGAQNFSMPAGYVEEDGVRWMVSVGDEITDIEELEALLLFDTGENAIGPILLSDVANIFVTDNSDESYARLGSEDSLMLSFEKQSNAATAEVCDALAETFEELEEEYEGLSFATMMDQGDYIYMIVASIMESLLAGALFSVIILFIFLRDIRPTVITLLSIPISVLFALVLMYFSGVTLNMISLSGLSIAVGMLVDNSIVVIENIYRLRAKGATAAQAAVAGTKQVAGAITSSTLTTVCVFLPIVFVEGLTKQLFTDLALTMGYALVASLLIALTLVPAMAKGLLKDRKPKESKHARKKARKAIVAGSGRGYHAYRSAIAWALDHKAVILILSIVLLIASAGAALSRGFSFMPDMDMNTVSLSVTMPENADMEEAAAISDEIIDRIQTYPEVESVGAMMGGSSLLSSGISSYDVTMYITLPEGTSGAEWGDRIVELCSDLDCEISYSSALIDMSMLSGSGVTLYLYGNDTETLAEAAELTAEALAAVDGISDVQNGLQEAEEALHVSIDRNAAMQKGWTVAQIYMEIATKLTTSATAMTLPVESTTADVMVEVGESITPEELMAMTFEYTNSDGDTEKFTLDDVAELEETISLASISRSDQRRYLSVNASIENGENVTLVSADAREAMKDVELPEGITYAFSGENETIMEAVGQLMLMLVLGIVLVYFVMVAQFQSLKSPFIVMFTIPLAFTGGFIALLIAGMDVSIISLIGFVMLVGIIVNNGIVLVEYVNQLRAEGLDRRSALIEAGVTRLRPILMTSLTTVLGLIVMAIGKDVGTALMQPVAVVCIGGLLYATLMTLFVIPCIYDMMNKKEIEVLSDEDLEFNEV